MIIVFVFLFVATVGGHQADAQMSAREIAESSRGLKQKIYEVKTKR